MRTETTGGNAHPADSQGRTMRPASGPLLGTATVPGDKSISHRAAILAALARGRSRIDGFSPAGDCAATLSCLEEVGARVHRHPKGVEVDGRDLHSPRRALDCGRSGTTMRLLAGALAGYPMGAVLTGHPQLLKRPMDRVAGPLRRMGAQVALEPGGRAPLRMQGGPLHGIEHQSEIPSAQVKSAVLLAGLRADGPTTVVEPVRTRDHTERLLAWLGVPFRASEEPGSVRITVGPASIPPFELRVPGDVSAAAPLLAAAALVPGSDVTVQSVGLNPTRIAFLALLKRMGARIDVEPWASAGPEPCGDVRVRGGRLRGVEVGARDVAELIDEIPLVGVLGALGSGTTRVAGASELRVKESDRIAGLVDGLRALGADAVEWTDGFEVRGRSALTGGRCDATDDHRLAMAFAVGALVADAPVQIDGFDYVGDSFPGFLQALEALR